MPTRIDHEALQRMSRDHQNKLRDRMDPKNSATVRELAERQRIAEGRPTQGDKT